MARRKLNTNQPAIDPTSRSSEDRAPWLGLLLAAGAVGVIFAGALLLRRVQVGTSQRTFNEVQINEAITRGGLDRVYANSPTSDAATRDRDQATEPTTAPAPPETAPLQKDKKTDDDFCPT
jgi:hypothetical protein